jgi:hypothetical protein
MGNFPVLTGSKNASTIEIFTPIPRQKDTNIKVSPPVLKRGTILPHVSKDTSTTWWGQHTIVPNVYMGVNKDITVHRMMEYDDCIILVGMVNNCIIHEFHYTNMGKEITVEENSETVDTETVTNNVTRSRTVKKKFECETVDICYLTYGDARKLFVQNEENKVYIEQRIFDYEARNRTENGKVIYEGALICPLDMLDKALGIIKSIADKQKKHTIVYNR